MQVTLEPLNDAEYADFAQRQVIEHARQQVNAGEWAEAEALDRARQSLRDLLEDSLRARGHLFFKGVNPAGQRIGWLWVGPTPSFLAQENARWLSQITIDEPVRGQGYGRALLVALEEHLRNAGVEELYLRVFKWNTVARHLYDSQGFEAVADFRT
ncbi:MAG TPA: GNAT family N-acetyltransferase, partial [Chloroflexota bacterium]|nr:GNAT family N-acetyltransferase [Chloroflexota bacterium]